MEKLTFRGAANPKNHFSVAAELQKINFAYWELQKINFLPFGTLKKSTFCARGNSKSQLFINWKM